MVRPFESKDFRKLSFGKMRLLAGGDVLTVSIKFDAGRRLENNMFRNLSSGIDIDFTLEDAKQLARELEEWVSSPSADDEPPVKKD